MLKFQGITKPFEEEASRAVVRLYTQVKDALLPQMREECALYAEGRVAHIVRRLRHASTVIEQTTAKPALRESRLAAVRAFIERPKEAAPEAVTDIATAAAVACADALLQAWIPALKEGVIDAGEVRALRRHALDVHLLPVDAREANATFDRTLNAICGDALGPAEARSMMTAYRNLLLQQDRILPQEVESYFHAIGVTVA